MEIHEPNIPKALDILVKGTEIDTVIAVPVFDPSKILSTADAVSDALIVILFPDGVKVTFVPPIKFIVFAAVGP